MSEKPWVKTYCGGKPNYCTPEETPEVTPEVTGEVTGEVQCKTHSDAPHGFDRNASHSADRYVCECESWEPVDAVNMSQERVDETAKGEHEPVGTYQDVMQKMLALRHGSLEQMQAYDYLKNTPLYTAPPSIEAAVLAEREACAKVCEEWNTAITDKLAERIRARGEK